MVTHITPTAASAGKHVKKLPGSGRIERTSSPYIQPRKSRAAVPVAEEDQDKKTLSAAALKNKALGVRHSKLASANKKLHRELKNGIV